MSLAIIQYGYEVKFGLHKMWGGLIFITYCRLIHRSYLKFPNTNGALRSSIFLTSAITD